MEATYPIQRRNPFSGLLLVVICACLLALLTLPRVLESDHAALHAEAELIRQCWDNGDLAQRWVSINEKAGFQRDYCLFDIDGQVGARIVQWCQRLGWIEITSFIYADQTMRDVVHMLRARGCSQVFP